MKIKKLILLALLMVGYSVSAQTKENPFYANGKIYVVVTVMSMIFIGIVTYLIILDRRLRKTEKEMQIKK
jgi:CcmD family protein